ncbi:MAG: DsbE family thiol:disulfide interchange protein [Oceanococcus sp.]
MTKLKLAIPLIIVVVLVAVLARGLELDPREVDSPLIGGPAPAFELPILGSDRMVSQEAFLDQVSLLNVWASWCVACRAEHDILVELGKRPDINLYGLNYKDATDDALNWLSRRGNPYRLTAQDRQGMVGIDWGVYGVPETFIIDKKGVVRAKRIGPMTWPYVNEELLPLQKLEAES